MSRLIVVSNRVRAPEKKGEAPAGGLAVALSAALREYSGFWFGWSGETASGFANRAINDLAPFKPTVATTCYGMNDGQYHPFTDTIGNNYENNMRKVTAAAAVAKSPTLRFSLA